MTTDVELLPLPRSLDVWFAHKMHVYASANVAHHTAAKDAEIERLRSEVERLAEALRELEEREQRDEALLRQALGRAHQTAMEQTLKARTPECAEFAGIAQDLDFVVAALRERLGVKA